MMNTSSKPIVAARTLHHKLKFLSIFGKKKLLLCSLLLPCVYIMHVKGAIFPELPNSAILYEALCEHSHTM